MAPPTVLAAPASIRRMMRPPNPTIAGRATAAFEGALYVQSCPTRAPAGTGHGASSGIGEALATCFAQGGHDLVLVARSADKLQQLAAELKSVHGVKVLVHSADLSLPGASGAVRCAETQACGG